MSLLKKTALYNTHLKYHAKMVDFAGFEMPIHYGSQLEEHLAVRKSAGIFDVSHMVVTDLIGLDSKKFLQYLLANDVSKLSPGQALYSCMLNPEGKVIDDLIIYDMGRGECDYRLVTNAGTREKDLAWITEQAKPYVLEIKPRPDLAILALQGPEFLKFLSPCLNNPELTEKIKALSNFHTLTNQNWFIAKTGYTGETGVEILLPHSEAVLLFENLVTQGVRPCGLGSRDTLRLEAGMNLYGLDMDETISPLESGLAWTVCFKNNREFIGRNSLEQEKINGLKQIQIGLMLEEKNGILRSHQKIFASCDSLDPIGETTSGSFSPTLETSIAFGRISPRTQDYFWVEIRNKKLKARVVKLPFVRYGQKLI